MREIALDTETTGFEPSQGHRVIEIGCVELIHGIKTGKSYQAYINPERDVPDEATKVHGITTDFLKDKPLFVDVAAEFMEFIGDARLVIHNAQFDVKFLNFELQKVSKGSIGYDRVLDTLEMARRKFPGSPASLDALCKRFEVSNEHRKFHGALLDAELLADVYIALTGGKQSSLVFDNRQTAKGEIRKKDKTFKEPRRTQASPEEKQAHMEFLKSVIKPIWLREQV